MLSSFLVRPILSEYAVILPESVIGPVGNEYKYEAIAT
jgi:hypothetical protein